MFYQSHPASAGCTRDINTNGSRNFNTGECSEADWPNSHIAKVGNFITISATAGVDPTTGQLAGKDVYSQTRRILETFAAMLASVNSDLNHVVHINIFLKNMDDFGAMNQAYMEKMVDHRPAANGDRRSRITMSDALLTMNLTAATKECVYAINETS